MTRTLCADNPEMWVGKNIRGRLNAARRCLICPALTACGIDALSNPPDRGVQAGVDYTPRLINRPFVTDCTACGLPMIGGKGKSARCEACVETKVCTHCGATFERPAKASQKQWETRVVCGLSCSARKNSPRRAAA